MAEYCYCGDDWHTIGCFLSISCAFCYYFHYHCHLHYGIPCYVADMHRS